MVLGAPYTHRRRIAEGVFENEWKNGAVLP